MASSNLASGVSAPQGPSRTVKRMLCFSDVDGTLVHYEDMTRLGDFIGATQTSHLTLWKEKDSEGAGVPVLRLPQTHSGSQGAISVQSLQIIARIRAQGAVFVLITGGRMATLLQRLPFLPAADAYVCENGGRIFYPGNNDDLPTACPLREDLNWRLQHLTAVGPPSQEWMRPYEREGCLWDAYRALKASGWQPDVASYTTCFRLKLPPGKSEEDLRQAVASLPAGLNTSFNLGSLDIYPSTSGKSRAGIYLLTHFRSLPEDSILLCDDDNDLCLADLVSRVFLPTITSDSVRRAIERDPNKFATARTQGIFATEEMLNRAAELVASHIKH